MGIPYFNAFLLISLPVTAITFLSAGLVRLMEITGGAVVDTAHALSSAHQRHQRRLFLKERPTKRLLSAEAESALEREP